MARSKGIIGTKEAEEAFKKLDVEKLIETLIKLYEEREGIKITYTLRKKTEEEMIKYPDGFTVIFKDDE